MAKFSSLGEYLYDEDPLESECYIDIYNEQQRHLRNGVVMWRFSRSITTLPNIHHVTFEDNWPEGALDHAGGTCWETNAVKSYQVHLLWVVRRVDSRIRKLELPLCSHHDLTWKSTWQTVGLVRFLGGIEELRLEMQDGLDDVAYEQWEREATLSQLLQRVHNLTRLELREVFCLRALLDPVTLPRLRSLTITGIRSSEDGEDLAYDHSPGLPGFFERHAATLEEVRFCDVSFNPEYWRILLGALRWKCRLKRCYIRPAFGQAQYADDMWKYVLGGPWTAALSEKFGAEHA
ncbi:MAG: hypothetical protein M1816_007466 [Peltula sp. TS41687]|nr:MAG: hypothetical protein M1816_007466 [Peltula sp. TS41687]